MMNFDRKNVDQIRDTMIELNNKKPPAIPKSLGKAIENPPPFNKAVKISNSLNNSNKFNPLNKK